MRDLKNKLSAYLREVRAGVRILVSDRDTVVAELHEPYLDRMSIASSNPQLSEWARSGIVRLPAGGRKRIVPSDIRRPDGTSLALLDQDRGESGP